MHREAEPLSTRACGVTITHSLSWTPHIVEISEKAGRILNILSYLQFKLDRKTLETIYFSFVRPKLEYASVVWSDCTQQDSDLLESVQKRAARIVSGGIRGTSSDTLYTELGWQPLHERRKSQCLCLFYRILNGLSPPYLAQYLPEQVGHRVGEAYNLRNREDLSTPRARTSLYLNSFFPRMSSIWNTLDTSVRNSPTLSAFKSKLQSITFTSNPLYYYGRRDANIFLARLRMNCSSLNWHLFNNHVAEHSRCACGAPVEDPNHYFFECPHFFRHRQVLLLAIEHLCTPTVDVFFHGCPTCSAGSNTEILRAVHQYIINSGRFN
jgi:hypothetical protein